MSIRFEIRDAAFKKFVQKIVAKIPVESEEFSLLQIIESELEIGIWDLEAC